MNPDDPRYPRKLLPFPWIFATRKLARRLIRRIEELNRLTEHQQTEILQLRSELNKQARS